MVKEKTIAEELKEGDKPESKVEAKVEAKKAKTQTDAEVVSNARQAFQLAMKNTAEQKEKEAKK